MDPDTKKDFGMPLKKPGAQYTRKELKKFGWTNDMIDILPVCMTKRGNSVYYRASDVAAALEANPKFVESLIEQKMDKQAKNRMRDIPAKQRAELAKQLSDILQPAFDAATIAPEIKPIAKAWHNLFMEALLAPQPSKNAMYSIICSENIIPKLQGIASRNSAREPSSTVSRAKKWSGVGRSAWTALAEGGAFFDVDGYLAALNTLAQVEFQSQLVDTGITEPASDILSVKAIQNSYPTHEGLYTCYLTYYVPAAISRDLEKLIVVDPKDEYPMARQMARRFEIHVGGTNTGKTYQSLQRLKDAATGVYLAPLRLLALEVQDRMLDEGVICSMLTGEEEDIRPGATHISSTVEKLDTNRRYDVAVIDECQLINDRDRGYAWTRAILGVQAAEIHLCVAPEGLHILERLIKDLGEPYTVIQHERKVPLIWKERSVKITQAQQGDAFVAFSKKRVLQLADELRNNGVPTSIIYGNLPYATRRRQMQMFLDGETTALVATDAIGMGLNLPIRRVVFTQDEKYDGVEIRPLNPGEVRQIAGRAGRFGIYDKGFAAAGPDCKHDLGKLLETVPPNIKQAALGFSDLVLKVDRPIIDVLKVWNQMPVKEPYYRMDITRYITIINYILNTLRLGFSKEDLLRAASIPFDEKDSNLLALFGIYCKAYASGTTVIEKPDRDGSRLGDLELFYKSLDLYYSFSKNFSLTWDKEWLMNEKELVAEEINYLLIHDLKNRGASCRRCGGPVPLRSPYSICNKCYQKQRSEREHKRYMS